MIYPNVSRNAPKKLILVFGFVLCLNLFHADKSHSPFFRSIEMTTEEDLPVEKQEIKPEGKVEISEDTYKLLCSKLESDYKMIPQNKYYHFFGGFIGGSLIVLVAVGFTAWSFGEAGIKYAIDNGGVNKTIEGLKNTLTKMKNNNEEYKRIVEANRGLMLEGDSVVFYKPVVMKEPLNLANGGFSNGTFKAAKLSAPNTNIEHLEVGNSIKVGGGTGVFVKRDDNNSVTVSIGHGGAGKDKDKYYDVTESFYKFTPPSDNKSTTIESFGFTTKK